VRAGARGESNTVFGLGGSAQESEVHCRAGEASLKCLDGQNN
jgi:hypothetical protein